MLCALALSACSNGGGATGRVPPLRLSTQAMPVSVSPTEGVDASNTQTAPSLTPLATSPNVSATTAAPDTATSSTESEARRVLAVVYAEAAIALQTNNTVRYDALVSSSCNCRAGIHGIVDRHRARSAHVTRGEVSIKSLRFESLSQDFASVTVTYNQAAADVVSASGQRLAHDPGATGIVDFVVLSRTSGKTLVTGVQSIGKGSVP